MKLQKRIVFNCFTFHLTLDNLLSAETLLAINNEKHFAIPFRRKNMKYGDVSRLFQWTDSNLLHTLLLKLVIEFSRRFITRTCMRGVLFLR